MASTKSAARAATAQDNQASASASGRPGPRSHDCMQMAMALNARAAVQQARQTATALQRRQRHANGLPAALKAGIESLSGLSMDGVRVHYNSAQPAQLQAHAFAQGRDIHLAPGQETHLPHEAWHVVQQAQGRVRPTLQFTGGVPVNDDRALEREADVMGARAAGLGGTVQAASFGKQLQGQDMSSAGPVLQGSFMLTAALIASLLAAATGAAPRLAPGLKPIKPYLPDLGRLLGLPSAEQHEVPFGNEQGLHKLIAGLGADAVSDADVGLAGQLVKFFDRAASQPESETYSALGDAGYGTCQIYAGRSPVGIPGTPINLPPEKFAHGYLIARQGSKQLFALGFYPDGPRRESSSIDQRGEQQLNSVSFLDAKTLEADFLKIKVAYDVVSFNCITVATSMVDKYKLGELKLFEGKNFGLGDRIDKRV